MSERTEAEARDWVAAHAARLRELEIASNLAAWEGATTGSEEALRASAETRSAERRLYSDPVAGAQVGEMLASNVATDPLLHRQLTLIALRYREFELPEEVIDDLSERESDL